MCTGLYHAQPSCRPPAQILEFLPAHAVRQAVHHNLGAWLHGKGQGIGGVGKRAGGCAAALQSVAPRGNSGVCGYRRYGSLAARLPNKLHSRQRWRRHRRRSAKAGGHHRSAGVGHREVRPGPLGPPEPARPGCSSTVAGMGSRKPAKWVASGAICTSFRGTKSVPGSPAGYPRLTWMVRPSSVELLSMLIARSASAGWSNSTMPEPRDRPSASCSGGSGGACIEAGLAVMRGLKTVGSVDQRTWAGAALTLRRQPQ